MKRSTLVLALVLVLVFQAFISIAQKRQQPCPIKIRYFTPVNNPRIDCSTRREYTIGSPSNGGLLCTTWGESQSYCGTIVVSDCDYRETSKITRIDHTTKKVNSCKQIRMPLIIRTEVPYYDNLRKSTISFEMGDISPFPACDVVVPPYPTDEDGNGPAKELQVPPILKVDGVLIDLHTNIVPKFLDLDNINRCRVQYKFCNGPSLAMENFVESCLRAKRSISITFYYYNDYLNEDITIEVPINVQEFKIALERVTNEK